MKQPKPKRAKPKRKNERGVALIAVLVAVAITVVISNQFGSATSIDLMAAANYRDQMQAHFLARSATTFGELLIRIQQRLDNNKSTSGMYQLTDMADTLVAPLCGSAAEVKDFGFDDTKGLGGTVGTCGFNGPITTDDDKLNVNCANNQQSWEVLKSALDALVYFPAYDAVFDENDAEGWQRDRQHQVSAIIDYIDIDSNHLRDRGTSEDYGYENLKDRYFAKNNYIDTTGELRLVRGVDDRFWNLFGSIFTAYGGCKVNVTHVSNVQLIAAILYLSAANRNDPVILDQRRLFLLAGMVAKARQYGEVFMTIDDFATFVKDPSSSVMMLAGQTSMAGSAASNALAQGLVPGEKIGLDLNKASLAQIATAGPRRTYRMQAYGEITRAQTDDKGRPLYPPIHATVTGVWDTKVVPQNTRKPTPKGAWVYLKED
jgi:type II secretory pathway component PulK